jgi:diguanylate cyclase (GGDEF)-like protein
MADLDHFKRVNDTLGHSAGDEVLRNFAALLRQTCRKADFPARSGGEEFLILLPMTNLQGALKLADRICALTRNLRERPPITVSLGVAQHVPGEVSDALLERVDQALYQAKESGRDRACAIQ